MKTIKHWTLYEWTKAVLATVGLAIMTWGMLNSVGHVFLGAVWLAAAFVSPDRPEDDGWEDVL